MSTKFGAAILSAASLFLVSDARALTFELDTTFNGATPASSTPWLTATFTQGQIGTVNTVNLALQSSLNVSTEFFGSLAFNFNPDKNPNTALTGVSQNGGSQAQVGWSQNAEDLQGGGNTGKGFDISILFETSNSGRFQGNDLITFIFSGIGITPADFDFSNASGLPIASHIQGLPNGSSGAITGGSTGETTVPDGSSTLILLGIGTTLFALVRRTITA